jgi:hypothetical protein
MEAKTVHKLRQSGHFLMQLDESTDLVNFAELLVYGRYLNGNLIEENILFIKQLSTTTAGAESFNMVEKYAVHLRPVQPQP